MIYVALLRGINVGGKNKIEMKGLKNSFEKAGMKYVNTYINTGNIIFSTNKKSKHELSDLLEKVIEENFNLKIKVLIRSQKEFEAVIKNLPKNWTNDQKVKTDILFLWEDINRKEILNNLTIKSGIDTVKYVPGAILWTTKRNNILHSGMSQLAKNKLYKKMTIRNVNTTRKIYEIMKSIN